LRSGSSDSTDFNCDGLSDGDEWFDTDDESMDSEVSKRLAALPQIEPKKIKEISETRKEERMAQMTPISDELLRNLKVKKKSCSSFKKQWNTKGTMTRNSCGIWSPASEYGLFARSFKQNRMRIVLGYYAHTGFKEPSKSVGNSTIEITDTGGYNFVDTDSLDNAVLQLCPHPLRFHLVWSETQGKRDLYAWRPVPPKGFLALGMVTTQTDTPPPLAIMQCVPKSWCVPSKKKPVCVWTDGGTGGRPGSIWQVGSCRLIEIVQGHETPKGPFWDIRSDRFMAVDFTDMKELGLRVSQGDK
jgi:hypothetical protein